MALNKNWFVHISGEIFGPVSSDVVNVMLRQARLQFTDFIWTAGLTKWVRIIDVDDFAGLLPAYPRSAIPSSPGKRPVVAQPEPPIEEEEEVVEQEEQVAQEEEHVVVAPVKVVAKKVEKKKPAEIRTGTLAPKAEAKPGSKLSIFPRMKVTGKINIQGGPSFKVVDISEGGLFVSAKECIEVGTEVSFTLESNSFAEIMAMNGVVIRHGERHDEKGFAIEFLRVNPVYKRMIQGAISKESGKS
jgi:hypothetical protein